MTQTNVNLALLRLSQDAPPLSLPYRDIAEGEGHVGSPGQGVRGAPDDLQKLPPEVSPGVAHQVALPFLGELLALKQAV